MKPGQRCKFCGEPIECACGVPEMELAKAEIERLRAAGLARCDELRDARAEVARLTRERDEALAMVYPEFLERRKALAAENERLKAVEAETKDYAETQFRRCHEEMERREKAEAEIERLARVVRDFVGSASHWRIFLTTRERIHADGLKLFDDVVTDARNLLEPMGMTDARNLLETMGMKK